MSASKSSKSILFRYPWDLRWWPIITVLVLAFAAGFAVHTFAQGASTTYFSACLNTSSGILSDVNIGTAPLNPCRANQTLITWSNGDILGITAGTGLTGGGSSGEVALEVASTYKLPQACASNEVAKWNSGTSTWQCGADNDTTYTAGPGLSLSSNQFSANFASTGSAETVARSDHTHILADGEVTTEKIAEGAVTTAKLAANAATQIQSISRVDDSNTNSTTFVDVPFQSVTLTTTGGAVLVMSSASYHMTPAGFTGYWQVIRDDSVVLAHNNYGFSTVDWTTLTLFGVDTPPAGTHTYKLQWRVNSASGTLILGEGVYTINLAAMEFKR